MRTRILKDNVPSMLWKSEELTHYNIIYATLLGFSISSLFPPP